MKRTFLLLFAICLLNVLPQPALAIPLVNTLRFSDNDEGIQGRMTKMIQGKNGFIWIATFNGLVRYDGYRFEKYKSLLGKYPELKSNRIDNIWETAAGDIWCLAGENLYLFKIKEDRFIHVQSALDRQRAVEPRAWQLFCLENGVTWIVCLSGECFRLQDDDPLGTCQEISYEATSYLDIAKVLLDARGQEWVLSKSGLYRYGSGEMLSKMHFIHSELSSQGILMLTSAAKMAFYDYYRASLEFVDFGLDGLRYRMSARCDDSTLLVCTNKGLFSLNLNTRHYSRLTSADWQQVYRDREGNYWGIQEDYSIVSLGADGKTRRYARPSDHTYTNYRVRFLEDDYGLLWLVFRDTDDVLYLDKSVQRFVRPSSGHRAQVARATALHEDLQGNFWYMLEHGIECLSLKNAPFERCPGLLDDEVRAIARDNKGRYWVSYRKQKVALYSSQRQYLGNLGRDGRLHNDPQYSFDASVYTFKQDSRGRLWLGSRAHGLFLLEEQGGAFHLTQFMHDENDPYSLSATAIYAVEEDDRGQLWIGGFDGGLNLYRDGKFVHYFNHLGKNTSARPTIIRCLKYLGNGELMIGAREGLFVINTHFDKEEDIVFYHNQKQSDRLNSMVDNDVMSILQRRSGELWISTNSGGVARITPRTSYLSSELEFKAVTKQQGLGSDIAYSIVEDTVGALWVLSPGNLSRLYPDEENIVVYDDAYFSHDPVFSEAAPLFDKGFMVLGMTDGLLSFNPASIVTDTYSPKLNFTDCRINNKYAYTRLQQAVQTNSLVLLPKERHLRIEYVAIDFQEKSHLKYSYFLEGVDDKWNESFNTTLVYTNLPAGHHVLHLKSSNSHGQWVDNEITLPIYVKPTFMQSSYGQLTLVALVLLLIFIVSKYMSSLYFLRHRLSVERELNDTKLKFFTELSHELRTPLSLIDGPVSELLEDKNLGQRARYYLEMVQKNVRRMLNTVNQILDFRKLQSNKMKFLIEQVNVSQYLPSIAENFSEIAQHHQIDFRVEIADENVSLWIDREKFEKIFFNLLSNAFKYTSDGKTITLRMTQDVKTVSVAVEDQGVGIHKDNLQRLFQPFETVVAQNAFKPSSGIGLSLVKQFVDGLHGSISVESQVGQGSVFRVIFLKGKEHFANDKNVEFYVADMAQDANLDAQYHTPISEMEGSADGERASVLIVEDNDELRNFTQRILSPSYNVLLAGNGQEGLQVAKQHWPDLIITDVMMPLMDGIEMIKHIKEDDDIYAIPIIVLSAKADMSDCIEAVQMGVDDYITKPFSTNYLKARVSALIARHADLRKHLMELISAEGGKPVSLARLEPDTPEIKPADELFLQEVMTFMDKNIEDCAFSIDDFAAALNMGRTTFYNKLKATTGLAPVDFVQQIRIKRAVQLIESRNYSISEVAYKTGFSDPKYFSRCFKKYQGVSPSTYLKNKTEDLNATGCAHP